MDSGLVENMRYVQLLSVHCVCAGVCVCVCVCVCVHVCVCVCIIICVCMCVCVHVYCVCMHTWYLSIVMYLGSHKLVIRILDCLEAMRMYPPWTYT